MNYTDHVEKDGWNVFTSLRRGEMIVSDNLGQSMFHIHMVDHDDVDFQDMTPLQIHLWVAENFEDVIEDMLPEHFGGKGQ